MKFFSLVVLSASMTQVSGFFQDEGGAMASFHEVLLSEARKHTVVAFDFYESGEIVSEGLALYSIGSIMIIG